MHNSRHVARRHSVKLLLISAMAVLLLAALAGPAFAGVTPQFIPLSGGVNEGGACTEVSGSGSIQTWEFNVDDIYGDTSTALLFVEFSDGSTIDGI